MSATIIPLSAYRSGPERSCTCEKAREFTCYPHRLLDLLNRVDDLEADVENFQFCDLNTFRRLAADVRGVLGAITDECLPNERLSE